MAEIKVKVCVVGETSVGKTCLIQRTIQNIFSENLAPTVANFQEYHYSRKGHNINFNIWDTAGQETYRSLVPMYWQKAHVIIVVFDITNENSYKAINEWARFIPETVKNTSFVVLVGNKLDLNDSRVVDSSKAEDLASILDFAHYYEVSAKTGQGIENMWDDIADSPEIQDIPADEEIPSAPSTDNNDAGNETNNDEGFLSRVVGYISSAVNYVKSFF